MGVLTSKEAGLTNPGKRGKAGGAKASSAASIKKSQGKGKLVKAVMWPSAPMGKCNVAYRYKGEEFQVKLIDRMYKLPANIGARAEREERKMFYAAGFIDASYYEGKKPKPPEKPKTKTVFTLGHPDNKPNDPVEGNYAVRADGQEFQFELVNGTVTTDNPAVAKVLTKSGFYEVRKEEVPL